MKKLTLFFVALATAMTLTLFSNPVSAQVEAPSFDDDSAYQKVLERLESLEKKQRATTSKVTTLEEKINAVEYTANSALSKGEEAYNKAGKALGQADTARLEVRYLDKGVSIFSEKTDDRFHFTWGWAGFMFLVLIYAVVTARSAYAKIKTKSAVLDDLKGAFDEKFPPEQQH